MCDPQETVKSDRERLMQPVMEMVKGKKTSVYLSKIPPILRACLIVKNENSEKNDSIFCMVQPYQIYLEVNRYRGEWTNPDYFGKQRG